MSSFNRVVLMGNLTRDPQLKQLPSGTPAADFGIAVNRRYKTAAGEEREETLFIDCSAFGRQAETIEKFCKKGKLLLVEGRLKLDTWDDADGSKRSKISVIVETFQFVGSRDESESAPSAPPAPAYRTARLFPIRPPAQVVESAAAAAKANPPAPAARGKSKVKAAARTFKDADIPF